MATNYIRSWFFSATPDIPEIKHTDADDDDDTSTIGDDDDTPALFPSLNSAQRASTSIPILTDSHLMPPPPVPSLARRQAGAPTPKSSSSQSTLALPPSTTRAPSRGKVALAPGHSALDWANLKASAEDLRGGVDTLLRIPPSELKQHRRKPDVWTAVYGKVYNITPYLPYHPGGEKEIMRAAGRDGTKLFAETHGWVNPEFMLDGCMVGILVPEPVDSD